MPTITGGKYIRYNSKRFFTMSTAIAVNGTTAVPVEAVQGSIGVTTHATGKSYWFVSDGVHWIANGGAVSSTAFADITGAASDNASLVSFVNSFIGPEIQSAVLAADFPKTNNTLTAVSDLTLNFEAGHWYRVTGQFVLSNPNATGGWKLDFGGSATATGVSGGWIARNSANDITFGSYISDLTMPMEGTPDDFTYFSVDFTIQVNAEGTLIPRFAQKVTDAFASSLLKYSTIQAVDVTP